MGGEGSGRRPSAETIVARMYPPPQPIGTDMYIPNLSGVQDAVKKSNSGTWKALYKDGDGKIQELSLGAANTVLTSNGAAVAPTFNAAASGTSTYLNFTSLSGCKAILAQAANVNIGTNLVYTCPADKKCLVFSYTFYNNSAGNIRHYAAVGVGANYYGISTRTTTATNASTSTIIGYVMEAGETLNLVTDTTNGANAAFDIVEVDSTVSIKSPKITSFINGDNTLYTCPAGYNSTILDYTLGRAGNNTFFYSNFSAGAITFYYHLVPSGQAVGASYKLQQAASNSAYTKYNAGLNGGLTSGDYVSINTSSNAAGQLAWINVIEIANP